MTHQTISRIGTVSKMTGLPKSSIYRKVADGEFPKPVKLGERSSGWVIIPFLIVSKSRDYAATSMCFGGKLSMSMQI